MNKEEFITKLQYALAGGMSGSQVAEHVRYYREYIDAEIQRGRTEEEVLGRLGEPRLLARSIIDANRRAGAAYDPNREYDEEAAYAREDGVHGQAGQAERVMLPGWFLALVIVVAVVIVIGLVSSLLYLFAPVIMVFLIVMLVVKLIQGNRR